MEAGFDFGVVGAVDACSFGQFGLGESGGLAQAFDPFREGRSPGGVRLNKKRKKR